MRGNVATIKLTARLSAFLSVITYLIAIKGVFNIGNLKWLPDNFLLAVFGGAFASMLVVLICEISKYFQNRESAETYLFSHLYYLYGQLQVISKNINFLVAQKDYIHKDSLTELIANSEAEMNVLYYADYAPYTKDNAVLEEKIKYNSKTFPVIQEFLKNCRTFKIAVITDKLNETKKELGIDNNAEKYAPSVLAKLSQQIQEPLSLLDEMLTKIDQHCHGRYNWPQLKDSLIERMPNVQMDMLEQFLQK